MKTNILPVILKFIIVPFILTFLIMGCESSDLTGKLIQGTIESYDAQKADSVYFMDYQLDSDYLEITKYHECGRCKISSAGRFSGHIKEPLYTYPVRERIAYNFFVSDTTVRIGYLSFRAYKGGIQTGNFVKCTEAYLVNPMKSNYSWFLYATKDVTISGTKIDNGDFKTVYDLKLEKGWNEVYYNFNSEVIWYQFQVISKQTITNRASEEIKWRFVNGQ